MTEVLVQVRAAGLSRGIWHLMRGKPYVMRLGLRSPPQDVPLERTPEAMRYLEAGNARGKIAITI